MTAPTLELADTAAQAIREINHRTRNADAFTGPAELYRLVAELALLVGGLPQLLGQLDQWLHTEHHADRLRTDNRTDPGQAVRNAAAQLADAGDAAHDLTHILASAQQCLAHLGATKPTAPPTKGVSFQPPKGGQYSTAVDTLHSFQQDTLDGTYGRDHQAWTRSVGGPDDGPRNKAERCTRVDGSSADQCVVRHPPR